MKKILYWLYVIFTIPSFILLIITGLISWIAWGLSAVVENKLFRFNSWILKHTAIWYNKYTFAPTMGLVIVYHPINLIVKVFFYIAWVLYMISKGLKLGGCWVFDKNLEIMRKAYKN